MSFAFLVTIVVQGMPSNQELHSALVRSTLLSWQPADRPLELGENALHLWTATMPKSSRFEAAACRALMSQGERLREAKFRFARDRRAYRWARALTRSVLCRYSAVDPRALEFTQSTSGKPEISSPANTRLKFSLAHTKGVAVLLVGQNRAVGVDIESERRLIPSEIALSMLGPAEAADLNSLPPRCRSIRFLEYWTLKESYAKACGSGLVLPLKRYEFAIEDGRIRVNIDAETEASPELWWFSLPPRTSGCITAIAASLHAAGEAPLEVRTFSALPRTD